MVSRTTAFLRHGSCYSKQRVSVHFSLRCVSAVGSNHVGYQPNRPPLCEATIHPGRLVGPPFYLHILRRLSVRVWLPGAIFRLSGILAWTIWESNPGPAEFRKRTYSTVETFMALVAYRRKIPGLCWQFVCDLLAHQDSNLEPTP